MTLNRMIDDLYDGADKDHPLYEAVGDLGEAGIPMTDDGPVDHPLSPKRKSSPLKLFGVSPIEIIPKGEKS